jgi:hypothetical protein
VDFLQDARRLHNELLAENNRNAYLKHLLFDSSLVYAGNTLFEQFSYDTQEEIKPNLGEIESVITECVTLLEKRYTWSEEKAKAEALTPCGEVGPSRSLSSLDLTAIKNSFLATSKSHLQLIRWSMKGKRRVETVISHFAKLNERIHEKIKLCSLASYIGVDTRHLERLQTDPFSIKLGFHMDASLKLMAENQQQEPTRLELTREESIDQVKDLKMIEERFAIGKWKVKDIEQDTEQDVLIEYRDYEPDPSFPNTLDHRTNSRVESLARLLQQPKEQVFRIPRCLWWTYVPTRILLAFKISGGLRQTPKSLLYLLRQELKLSLNNKFKLALGLSKCLAQLQMVKWVGCSPYFYMTFYIAYIATKVHESFRSENILFWSFRSINTNSDKFQAGLDFSQPWVLGFEKSRPEAGFSCALTDVCLERDSYRHPDRQGRPEKSFHKLHDIYALGKFEVRSEAKLMVDQKHQSHLPSC